MRKLTVLAAAALATAGCAGISGPDQATANGPDGQIAFARSDPTVGGTVTYTVNPDGSHQRQLFVSGPSGDPRWSPDGSQVVITAACTDSTENCAATIVDPGSGTFRQLKWPDPTLETDCDIWSADGQRLACESFGVTDPGRNGIYTIRTSDGRGLTRITSNPGGDDSPADYSPDGSRLVFLRIGPGRPATAKHALFVINLDGTGLHRITPWGLPGSEATGSWSPNGRLILFGNGNGSLYVVHPDGTGLAKIPLATGSLSHAFAPGWSPTGTKIVVVLDTRTSQGTLQEGIYTANADGTEVHRVTNAPVSDISPDWGTHPLAS
jgi:Tol biopolymer transport system component